MTILGLFRQYPSMLGVAPFATSLEREITSKERSCFEAFQGEFDYLCRTLRRLGARPADVEDAAQEVFLVLRRKWAGYDDSRPLRPYLFSIAYRVVAANKRKQWRELPYEEREGTAPQPDEALEATRDRALVLAALDRVPLRRRAVLVMHDIDEIQMHEIAKTLSIPLFTGYSRLRKARQEFEAAVKAIAKGTPEP